ncbi:MULTISPECIES: inositol monophosphatase family protein [unclassified Microbacterium]|uniref:inositol monophosphatase family protein n=1 Tax=unclassified Microbacterium TaxID=2609290 RepID=UPI0008F45CCF|nr:MULTISPECIES: inositol monophosphatase family protein [unclassified Microbacterium]OIJ34133.1 inositol monophosphatase [Microbacterium sp. LCT-H2]
MTDVLELRALAAEIAEEAGALARARRREGVRLAATKSTLADIVTEADREVEALIRERLRAARPADGFLGEESGAAAGDSGITWVVDPIDGTVNYAYGIPAYNVSIAAVSGPAEPDAWEALAAAVHAPAVGETFTAARGHGAWSDGVRLAVTEATDAGALLATGFGYDPATHDGDLATVRRVMPIARDLRRMGSAALDLAYVAAGRLDGYFERGLKPWDHAAGALLVQEAGGRVSRIDRESPRPFLIAGGVTLHDRLRDILDEEKP